MEITHSDKAIEVPTQDAFNRWPFSQRIADSIINRHDTSSIVIAIYGSWGDGKTSVLNLIKHELKNSSSVVVFEFNPWRYFEETKMLENFYLGLSKALNISLEKLHEKLGKVMKSGKFLGDIFKPAAAVEEIGKILSSVSIEVLKERMNKIITDSGKKLVVLIDDIDRLEKIEIQSLFRLVKLNADFFNTTYILAFDDEIVAAALKEKYSNTISEPGRMFLEKIVQIPLDLPKIPTESIRDFTLNKIFHALEELDITLTEDEKYTFFRGYIIGLEPMVKTPRHAIRFVNVLSLTLPILREELYLPDLMLIEGIRLFIPKIYEIIKCNPRFFLGNSYGGISSRFDDEFKKQAISQINDGFSGLSEYEVKAAKDVLIILFPRLQSVFDNVTYGSEWDIQWARNRRISSTDYFHRYISYSIPIGDVADSDIDTLIHSISIGDDGEIERIFANCLAQSNQGTWIRKLRQRVDQLSPAISEKMAYFMARLGNIFDRQEQMFSFKGNWSQAAMLISDLIMNIENVASRINFVSNIINSDNPLSFVAEILRWLKTHTEDGKHPLTSDEIQSYSVILANRIEEISKTKNLFFEYPRDIIWLLDIWGKRGNRNNMVEYVNNELLHNSNLFLTLLRSIVGKSYSMESGEGRVSNFDDKAYKQIIEFVNPNLVMTQLNEIYGDTIFTAEYPSEFVEVDDDLRLVQQFRWIHNKMLTPPE